MDEIKKLEDELEKTGKSWFRFVPYGSSQCPVCEGYFVKGLTLLGHYCGSSSDECPRADYYCDNRYNVFLYLFLPQSKETKIFKEEGYNNFVPIQLPE